MIYFLASSSSSAVSFLYLMSVLLRRVDFWSLNTNVSPVFELHAFTMISQILCVGNMTVKYLGSPSIALWPYRVLWSSQNVLLSALPECCWAHHSLPTMPSLQDQQLSTFLHLHLCLCHQGQLASTLEASSPKETAPYLGYKAMPQPLKGGISSPPEFPRHQGELYWDAQVRCRPAQ